MWFLPALIWPEATFLVLVFLGYLSDPIFRDGWDLLRMRAVALSSYAILALSRRRGPAGIIRLAGHYGFSVRLLGHKLSCPFWRGLRAGHYG